VKGARHVQNADGVSYQFNSLGFRGDEYDARSRYQVFLFGDSNMFGLGLNEDQTFANYLKSEIASRLRCEVTAVNVMNFASMGASNDHIARMVLTQCSEAQPDCVIVNFTYALRSELLSVRPDGTELVTSLGPWCFAHANWITDDLESDPAAARAPARGALSENQDLLERIECYYAYYSAEVGVAQYLRNMLAVQHFLRARGLHWLYADIDEELVASLTRSASAALRPMVTLREGGEFWKPSSWIDFATDGIHPGPATCAKLASQTCELIARRGWLQLRGG
jgi:hypothetical protein